MVQGLSKGHIDNTATQAIISLSTRGQHVSGYNVFDACRM